MEVDHISPFLRLLAGPPPANPLWKERPTFGVEWRPVLDRLALLRQASLTSMMVVFNFFRRHLAPLQACLNSVWAYTRDDDITRLAHSVSFNYDEEALSRHMKLSTSEKGDIVAAFPPAGAVPLCEHEVRHAILDHMPRTNAYGLVPGAAQPVGGEAPYLSGEVSEVLVDVDADTGGPEERDALPSVKSHGTATAPADEEERRGKHMRSPSPAVNIPSSSSSSPDPLHRRLETQAKGPRALRWSDLHEVVRPR